MRCFNIVEKKDIEDEHFCIFRVANLYLMNGNIPGVKGGEKDESHQKGIYSYRNPCYSGNHRDSRIYDFTGN